MRTIPRDVAMRAIATEVRKAQSAVTDADVNQLLRAVTSVLDVVADEWDSCVQWRLDELGAYRELLRRGEALVDAGLADRLAALLDAPPPDDFRVSALDDRLDALRGGLSDLASWLEEHPGAETTALWRDIWDRLLAGLRKQTARWGMTAY